MICYSVLCISYVANIKYRLIESHLEKTFLYICKTKGADQLYGYRAADQHLWFLLLLLKSENLSL